MRIGSCYNWLKKKYQRHKRFRITRILDRESEPVMLGAEQFDYLQSLYQPRKEYGYTSFDNWKRGVNRSVQVLEHFDKEKTDYRMIDLGCGDGMTAYAFHVYGSDVVLVDMEDWREKRAKPLYFLKTDICERLPFNNDEFDLAYSFNTFEHLKDPQSTFDEMVRICKPGGIIYLSFGPLYRSPWGLHAYRSLRMPYPQFLFTTSFIEMKLHEIGLQDLGREMTSLQYTNGWAPGQFCALWKENQRVEILSETHQGKYTHLDVVLKYSDAFCGRSLSYEDITTNSIDVVLRVS